jgi:hypothetical protein
MSLTQKDIIIERAQNHEVISHALNPFPVKVDCCLDRGRFEVLHNPFAVLTFTCVQVIQDIKKIPGNRE